MACASVILMCGLRMAGLADRLADRTGLGEALIGGVLLGAATSLSGTVVSVTAAMDGRASLAFSNGIGGIAAQTAFLALADLMHRRANLEHAAAELANIFQCILLLLMLSLPVVAWSGPDISFWNVHPVSALLIIVYLVGVYATRKVRKEPMWKPVETKQTEEDRPDSDHDRSRSTWVMFAVFLGLMAIMGVAGWVLTLVASELTDRYDLSASIVGALMTAVLTSLPELVTTIAAVRRGALQLAVGGIIGGNIFDVLFLTFSDVGYMEGSIYHAVTVGDQFWLAISLAMTSVLGLGMIYRQRHGPGGIGVESVGILAIYVIAILIQFV